VSPTERLPRPLLRGTRGAVACGHPLAAEAGLRMLAGGGNAVDAAVAAAFTICVALPDACGLGGDALALLRSGDGTVTAINGSGESPAGLRGPIPEVGGGTATVPGAVAGLAELHRAGALAWERVLTPAIELADGGMPLTEDLASLLRDVGDRLRDRCRGWPPLAADLRPGVLVRQPALAAVLRRIAGAGPDAFYRGEIAAAIERADRGDGGWLSTDDLARHVTSVLAPVQRERLGVSLAVQPPISQASLLLTALRALQRAGTPGGLDRIHVLAEALEAAFAHRDAIADPASAPGLPDLDLAIPDRHAPRAAGPTIGAHTTAVTTADGEGRCVSMLVSVFDPFGSGLLVPEGGFLLNNRARGFTAGANAPGPARRPVHTLSPTLVDDGERAFALCTPGADGQVQTLAQLLCAVALDGRSLPAALDAPRFRVGNGRLAIERDAAPAWSDALTARGHDVVALAPGEAFGTVAAAGLELSAGTVFAASDPRREGWAGVL